jgi:hypothetical protein
MRRRNLVILLIAVVVFTALAGGLYWRWVNSPRYALQKMALALKTRDMPQFFNYLDIKAIFNDFVESAGRDLDEPKGGKEDEWNRMSRKMGGKFARMFLPKLFESFEKEIKVMMENYLRNLDNRQILAIAAAATTAKIEAQGEEAAQVTLVNPKNQEALHFQMQRHPETKTWRIVSVDYRDLKKFSKRGF